MLSQKSFFFNAFLKKFKDNIEEIEYGYPEDNTCFILFKKEYPIENLVLEHFKKITFLGIAGSFQTYTKIFGNSRKSLPYRFEMVRKNILKPQIFQKLSNKLMLLNERDTKFDNSYIVFTNDTELTKKVFHDEVFIGRIKKSGLLQRFKFDGMFKPQFLIFTDDSPVSAIFSFLAMKRLAEII